MAGHVSIACLLAVCAAATGCVVADGPYNQPSRVKLHLESPTPQAYTVHVASNAAFPVGADGRVVVDVPRLERGHATYLLGVAKVSQSSPYDIAAIDLKEGGKTVRKLSLNDLKKLPTDSEGYTLVKPE
jgi:hypothetical protein